MIRWTAHGRGDPVTLVVHGLGATPGEARLPASGLPGTRVVVTLPGHGRAEDPDPDYWSYDRVAEDIEAIADEVAASRAVGVSLGAGALTNLAVRRPRLFQRLALIQPAALAAPRDAARTTVFTELIDAVERAATDDGALLHERIRAGLPAGVRVGDYVDQRANALLRLLPALRALPGRTPVRDAACLAAVHAPVLVVAAAADPMHPLEVARDTAGAFPHAELVEFASSAPMLTHRADLRTKLRAFLTAQSVESTESVESAG